jgi:hypothetical protein
MIYRMPSSSDVLVTALKRNFVARPRCNLTLYERKKVTLVNVTYFSKIN